MTDDMNTITNSGPSGAFSARYLAFLDTIAALRPSLHRYCSRMTGTVMDGEDMVQETLFQAYVKLESYDSSKPLNPWLFRIAHNRCIDFLRRRDVRQEAEAAAAAPDFVLPVEPPAFEVDRALEHLVLALPPKERACVLLKDVLDYSIEEIAELVGSTPNGVKAALSRGRSKVTEIRDAPKQKKRLNEDLELLLRSYVDQFNHRDWDSLRELIADDAQLRVADRFAGRFSDSPYFTQQERAAAPWLMAVGEVDGEAVVVKFGAEDGEWEPRSIVRLEASPFGIIRLTDYGHCPWVLAAASSLVVRHPERVFSSADRRILGGSKAVITCREKSRL